MVLHLCGCGRKADRATESALDGCWIMSSMVDGSDVMLSDTLTLDVVSHKATMALELSIDSVRLSYMTVGGTWSATATDISVNLDRESVRIMPGRYLSQRIDWTDCLAGLSSDDFSLSLGIDLLSPDSLIVTDGSSSTAASVTYRFGRRH